MPIPSKKKYTADEFFKLVPETSEPYELMEGEIVALAALTIEHQRISRELSFALNGFIKSKGGRCEVFYSPTDVKLSEDTVVQPDVFIACDPDKFDKLRYNGAPDLIIEIASSNKKYDFIHKLGAYKKAGVKEYWIVDPEYRKTVVYIFDDKSSINFYTFEQPIPVGIYGGELSITIADIL